MKAVILARVSTEEQKDAGNSLPAQIERIQSYCQRKGFAVAEVFSFDESAYKTKRDEFDKILEFLEKTTEKIAVCFDKVDRLSRNVFDKRVSTLYEKAVNDQIELHFVSDGQIINNQMSAVEKFQFGMSLGLAKYYSDAISDNVVRAFEQKRRDGEITGRCRIGYINALDPMGNKTVSPDPDRSHLVIKIFEMYGTGNHSMKTILEDLTKAGLRSRDGFKLSKSSIENILREPFYHGIARSKKYNQDYPHKYERLISKELFDRCQKIRLTRKKEPYKALSKDFIFKGLLRCQNCNCTMTPEIKKGRFIYYSCTNSKGQCKRVYVPENQLLKPVYDVLSRLSGISEGIQNLLVTELRKTTEAEVAFHQAQLGRIRNEQDQFTKRKDALLDYLLDQSITKELLRISMTRNCKRSWTGFRPSALN
ncbi:recombinase family protein [Patescibacteria group bacterium]|nr:recombinase family protein [Patescibacteria group bacterium]